MGNAPQRIVSLAPSNTEILFALGLGDNVVGVTRYCDYPEGARAKEMVEGFVNPDLDKVIALRPDLVVSFGTLQKRLTNELVERGQTVFWTYPRTVDEILDSYERIGEATGRPMAARELRKRVEEKIEKVSEKLGDVLDEDRPTVFRVHSARPGYTGTIGGGAFQTGVYHLAGGRNIFAGTMKDYFEVDTDTLRELDPDIIVVAGKDTEEVRARLRSIDRWEHLTAVKTGRVVAIPAELVCRAGPRIGAGIERLAREFHPERFR